MGDETSTLPSVPDPVAGHIVLTPDTCGGRPRLAGRRITVQNIVLWHERGGLSPDEIVSKHPGLTLADVYAALAYYHDHREQISAQIRTDEAFADQLRARSPSPLRQKQGALMPRTIRFHLDEHVDPVIADGLRRRGVDVTTTSDVGLIGATDPTQLDYIRAEQRLIFTQDADFLRLHAAGEAHSGIAYCHQQSRSIGEIIHGLILIWELLDPEDMRDRVEFL